MAETFRLRIYYFINCPGLFRDIFKVHINAWESKGTRLPVCQHFPILIAGAVGSLGGVSLQIPIDAGGESYSRLNKNVGFKFWVFCFGLFLLISFLAMATSEITGWFPNFAIS